MHPQLTTARPTRRPSRLLAAGVVACFSLGVAACGSDSESDEASAEELFCEAGDSLRTDITALADLDIISEGTSGLQERFSTIEADIDQLRESGSEVASEEISTLETAVSDFGTTLEDLGNDISAQGAVAVGSALSNLTSAASGVFDALSSTCD